MMHVDLATTVVVGLGADGFRDRALGPEVVRRLRRLGLDEVVLVESDGHPGEVLHRWPAEHVVVVAAISPGYALPGRLHTLVMDTPRSLPVLPGLEVAEPAPVAALGAHTLLFDLQRMPRRLALFTVDVGDVSPGAGFSRPVRRVLDHLVQQVYREVVTAGPAQTRATGAAAVR